MLRDRTLVWVVEYIFGGMLVLLPMMGLYFGAEELPDAHIWAVELFIVCLGVVLISCASSMRQRMALAKRIEQLAEQMAEGSGSLHGPAAS